MKSLFKGIYKNKKVLVTGHTGFKGSWLVLWLKSLGAEVMGFSLAPEYEPNHFSLLNPNILSIFSDIRDRKALNNAFSSFRPEIVFHLAAQSLVRPSYENPIETIETNIMGTANILESCRESDSVKAIVNITSDKCYENNDQAQGYRETDRMGGHDPYSASKGCSELITSSYRNSFFDKPFLSHDRRILLASARAGNAIGGGDWARYRIITDIINAACSGNPLLIRCPHATRPWQHVLDPLSGYLLLGQKLLAGKQEFAEAWNFGPESDCSMTVIEVAKYMRKKWCRIEYSIDVSEEPFHESAFLKLNCAKSRNKLHWKCVWGLDKALEKTVQWYQSFYERNDILTTVQLQEYIQDAQKGKLVWAS